MEALLGFEGVGVDSGTEREGGLLLVVGAELRTEPEGVEDGFFAIVCMKKVWERKGRVDGR